MSENTIETNPWTTLSTREAYSNPWIRVREDQVLNPSGGPGIYGVVEYQNRAQLIAVVPRLMLNGVIKGKCLTFAPDSGFAANPKAAAVGNYQRQMNDSPRVRNTRMRRNPCPRFQQ
jgi:hypothetical protein